jgi:hypothetical protein
VPGDAHRVDLIKRRLGTGLRIVTSGAPYEAVRQIDCDPFDDERRRIQGSEPLLQRIETLIDSVLDSARS